MIRTQILLVDDDPLLRRVLAAALRRHGYAVQEAQNGQEALAWYDLLCPDIVVLDIVMPVKEGFETILELRQRPRKSRLIAMSGGGLVSAIIYLKIASAHGVDGLLEKPFSCSDLLDAIEAAMHSAAMAESAQPPVLRHGDKPAGPKKADGCTTIVPTP